ATPLPTPWARRPSSCSTAPVVSGGTRPRRCSTRSVGATRSTTSTSSTAASCPRPGVYRRPSPSWRTRSGWPITSCSDSAPEAWAPAPDALSRSPSASRAAASAARVRAARRRVAGRKRGVTARIATVGRRVVAVVAEGVVRHVLAGTRQRVARVDRARYAVVARERHVLALTRRHVAGVGGAQVEVFARLRREGAGTGRLVARVHGAGVVVVARCFDLAHRRAPVAEDVGAVVGLPGASDGAVPTDGNGGGSRRLGCGGRRLGGAGRRL